MRLAILFCCCYVGLLASEARILDKPMRYVERDLITLHDIQERLLLRLRAEKRQPPQDRKELEQLHIDALEEITDETLLLQEADRMGFSLTPSMVYDDVRKQWEESNQVPDPRVLADIVKARIRTIKIQTVIRHYLDMAPSIRPLDIQAHYEEHVDDFSRPARWRVYQILMVPSDANQQQRVFEQLLVVYRGIQDSKIEAITSLVTEETSKAFLAMEFGGNKQIQFLIKICDSLLALELEEPGPVTAELLAHAKKWSEAATALRSKESITELLEQLREDLLAIEDDDERLQLFTEKADAWTMGLGAGRGGDLGKVELESQPPAVQEQLPKLNAGDVSPVFWSGEGAILLYIDEKESALKRGFNEVNGEIRKYLEKRQQEAIRLDLIKQLRDQSTILDL